MHVNDVFAEPGDTSSHTHTPVVTPTDMCLKSTNKQDLDHK